MAVAIVLGLAFIELIKAFISCLVTPLFAAIWKKDRRFADMKWVLRGSEVRKEESGGWGARSALPLR